MKDTRVPLWCTIDVSGRYAVRNLFVQPDGTGPAGRGWVRPGYIIPADRENKLSTGLSWWRHAMIFPIRSQAFQAKQVRDRNDETPAAAADLTESLRGTWLLNVWMVRLARSKEAVQGAKARWSPPSRQKTDGDLKSKTPDLVSVRIKGVNLNCHHKRQKDEQASKLHILSQQFEATPQFTKYHIILRLRRSRLPG